ncbi:MAG: low temperature requirement protein A [Solirubrobacterales bacterium]
MEGSSTRSRRLSAALREGERVSPLELFFDLVFVLAITQCTALMADNPTWEGLGQGLLILALLWWAWVGYSWLTSVVDPEDDRVRIGVFCAMTALLIVSICLPAAFEDLALEFAIAYGAVRYGQLGLFSLAARDDPELRRSLVGLAVGTTFGIGLLIAGSFLDATGQAVVWSLALVLDIGEPYVFGAEGWKLEPAHFAERHALIVLIALGESIVAIGIGAEVRLTAGIAAAAALGIAVTAAMWWTYFDVVALVAGRRLVRAEPGREQNEMARDSYSYLHFAMIAGIVLVALGLKKTLADVDHALKTVPAVALLGGVALYLLGHVAFRYRHIHTLNRQRLALAAILLAAIPLAIEVPALAVVAALAVALWALIAYETRRYGEDRGQLRAELRGG